MTYTLPTPAVTAPEGYVLDAKDRLVPASAVKPVQALEDQTVRKIIGYAVDLANQISRFKINVFADTSSFMSLAAEQYGVTKRGAEGKGNITFTTYDGLMQVKVQVADHLAFGPELHTARRLFDECLVDWTADARPELRTIVTDAFQTDKEGQVSRDAIFRLLRIDFDDERWKQGQEAIKDSIRIVGSKAYCRFYVRARATDPWSAIPVDLAAV